MSGGMNETPDEPRPPGEDAGDPQDPWPHRRSDPPTPPGAAGPPTAPPTAPTGQPPYESPTQQALSDLPPLDDEVADGAGQRGWLRGGRLVAASVAVVVLLGGGVALARGGGDEGSDGSDGVATVDGSDGDQAQSDDDGGGGGNGRPDQSEVQDAMLEYAECMREHGIDMPDPEFDGDGGGMVIQGGPGSGEGGSTGGPGGGALDSDEFEAADEACSEIMEDVRGEMPQMSPEDQAEMQDQLVAMAECMREKGYDFPDPEVSSDGRVQIEMNGKAPFEPGDAREEQMREDQQDCNEEAGLENGPMAGGPPVAGSGGDSDDGSST